VEKEMLTSIEAFKLALYNLCKISPKPIEYAKVCLRIAWLYRMKKDEQQEIKFLNHALSIIVKLTKMNLSRWENLMNTHVCI